MTTLDPNRAQPAPYHRWETAGLGCVIFGVTRCERCGATLRRANQYSPCDGSEERRQARLDRENEAWVRARQ